MYGLHDGIGRPVEAVSALWILAAQISKAGKQSSADGDIKWKIFGRKSDRCRWFWNYLYRWNLFLCTKVCIKEYFPKGVAFRPENHTGSHSYGYTQYSVDVYTEHKDRSMTAYMGGLKTYIKEAENLAKFYTMPGIVSVRDFFYGNRTAYIVMEYLQGITLKQYARNSGGKIETGAAVFDAAGCV